MIYKSMPDADDAGFRGDLLQMAELQQLQQRRRMLNWLLSGSAAVMVAACGGGGGSPSTSGTGGTGSTDTGTGTGTASCILNATETNGPFPGDGTNTLNGSAVNALTQSGVLRNDIRSSFGSSSTVAGGVPFTLTMNVVNANNNCAALANYAVYVWHCDRAGLYSMYSNGAQNENYLRGVAVTNSSGQVTFTTIIPGCYAGRYPHIHFEVYSSIGMATFGTNSRLISQLALPRDICTTVYASATGYSASVANLNNVTISSDGVFGDNTAAQIAQMTATMSGSIAAGYTGTITVGVAA
jgi:protocatechuate 3,4-dioxygenase beta subunit